MINNNDVNISNKSYINKDFQTIYPELLELAQKLSSRWNPTQSNESDAGIVLLKLLSFIADKNNYNIDKNILEAFMPSATQESSMRNLCEMNGYEMRYYQSATTNVSFTYTDTLDNGSSITLKKFDTTLTNSDNDISYVLLEDVILSTRNVPVQKVAMEGTLKNLSIDGSNTILLTNLDDNNRIYFPEVNVAENGIFVYNEGLDTTWDKVTNLNFCGVNDKAYKFGFDSLQNLPYLEFTSSISSLIGDGLNIRYILTNGVDGNISYGTLNKLLNQTTLTKVNITSSGTTTEQVSVDNSNLIIKNIDSSINGADKETIEEAYNNYKRTIGTFNTIVTCRDYANAIYNLMDEETNSTPIVSNVQVADRRTDINYANVIITLDENGQHKTNIVDESEITPFDLCIYAFNPLENSYNALNYVESYNRTFKPISSGILTTGVHPSLEDEKLISHNYKSIKDNDIFAYKNYIILNAQITTNNKVSTYERTSIISNIRKALYNKFNAREIDFGYEIPFDSLLEVIQNADSRIKNVSLSEPQVNTKVLLGNGEEVDYLTKTPTSDKYQNITPYVELLAKNVLAGKINLFDLNNLLNLEFGQSLLTGTTTPLYEDLTYITTEAKISKEALNSTTGYTLQENEIVQFIAPNLYTETTYPVYVNYNLRGGANDSNLTIKANQDFELTGEIVLSINYTDSDDTQINVEYTSDKITVNGVITAEGVVNIIRPSFDMVLTDKLEGTPTKTIGDLKYYSLGTNDTIEIRKPVKDTLSISNLPCYWTLNNSDNVLFTKDNYKDILLQQGEYFIYTNAVEGGTSLTILGSGTKLSLANEPTDNWVCGKDVTTSDIESSGLNAFSKSSWIVKNVSVNNLTIEEMRVITLTTDNRVIINGELTNDLTNSFQRVGNNDNDFSFTYVIDEVSNNIEPVKVSNNYWQVRSRLDLNCGYDSPQELKDNHSITLYKDNENYIEITKDSTDKNTYIAFSTLLQSIGGDKIDIRTIDTEGNVASTIDAFVYCWEEVLYDNLPIERDGDNFVSIKGNTLTTENGLVLPIISFTPANEENKLLLTVYFDKQGNSTLVPCITASNKCIRRLGDDSNSYANSVDLESGLNTLEIKLDSSITSIELKTSISDIDSNDSLRVGKPTYVNNINKNFKLSKEDKDDLLKEINAKSNGKFYYLAELDNNTLINSQDLSDARALWDTNNLGNKFTISQIDFENEDYSIDIVKSSRA